jgi:hypothetical protein
MSSQSSGSNDHANGDEDEPSSTYGIPLQRWIDQACGYPFRQDFMIRIVATLFSKISSLPPISMSFIS